MSLHVALLGQLVLLTPTDTATRDPRWLPDWLENSPTLSNYFSGLGVWITTAILGAIGLAVWAWRKPLGGWLQKRWRNRPVLLSRKRYDQRLASRYESGLSEGREAKRAEIEPHVLALSSDLTTATQRAATAETSATNASKELELLHSTVRSLRQELKQSDDRQRAAKEEGRAQLQEELERARRKPIIRPRWNIKRILLDGQWVMRLENAAETSVARDVSVNASSLRFTFEDAAAWGDVSGSKQVFFKGSPVSRVGSRMLFRVEWTNEHGDRDSDAAVLFDSAPEPEAAPVSTRKRLARPSLKLSPPPRWKMELAKGLSKEVLMIGPQRFVLTNMAVGSFPTSVRAEAPDSFRFEDAAQWAVVPGNESVHFTGRGGPAASSEGIQFWIHWTNEAGEELRDKVRVDPWFRNPFNRSGS